MDEAPVRRGSVWVLLVNLLSYGLSAFVLVALLMQLSWIVGLVGFGPGSGAGPLLAMARFHPGPLPIGVPALMMAAGILLVAALRNPRSAAWSLGTALTPIPLIGMVSFEMLAYRLVGLIALGVGAWAYVRFATGRGKLGLLVCACLVLVLAGALPFDISLQDVPGGPRWVPAVAGLPSHETQEAAARGEHVVVGGCVAAYAEPTWVWVW